MLKKKKNNQFLVFSKDIPAVFNGVIPTYEVAELAGEANRLKIIVNVEVFTMVKGLSFYYG